LRERNREAKKARPKQGNPARNPQPERKAKRSQPQEQGGGARAGAKAAAAPAAKPARRIIFAARRDWRFFNDWSFQLRNFQSLEKVKSRAGRAGGRA